MTMTEIPAHVPHRIAEDVSSETGINVSPEEVQGVISGEIRAGTYKISPVVFRAINDELKGWGIEVSS